MTCDNELLNLYIDGMLDERSRLAVEAHASDCEACGSALAFLRRYRSAIACGINEVEPPDTLLPSAIAAARTHRADARRYTAVAHKTGSSKRVNWRAWTTAAAAVIVAVGVGIGVMAWQGVFDGSNAAATAQSAPEMAAYDGADMAVAEAAVEESVVEEAAPAEAPAAAEPAATALPDDMTKASGAGEAPASAEGAATESAAGATRDDTTDDGALQPLVIDISPKYFEPVRELLREQNVDITDQGSGVYICNLPDDETAAALHKLLKKFGLNVVLAAGQELTFNVVE